MCIRRARARLARSSRSSDAPVLNAISQNVVYLTVLHTGLRYGRGVPSPFGGRMLRAARASLKATVPSPPPASGMLERLLMLSAVALIALGIAIALF